MSFDACKYHPGEPSVWRCESCHIEFCPDCIPGSRENYDGETPRCALCNSTLNYLGAANRARPFWKCAHTFFGYPFKTTGLMALGFIGIVTALLPANLLGVIGAIFLFAFTIHFGLRVIDEVRNGNMEPPAISTVLGGDGDHLFLKQVAVFIVLGMFVAAAGMISPLIGIAMMIFVLLAIPAATMLLAMTREVGPAISPLKLAVLMLQIGPSYLLLWFCLMIVASGPSVVAPLLVASLPQQVLGPVVMVVSSYFTIVTYAMMGYILYEKQAKLGFASQDDFGEHLEYRAFQSRKGMAEARILATEGRYEQALAALRQAISADGENARLRDYYYRVVSATDDREAIERNTHSICEFYVGKNLPERAADFCNQTLAKYPDFLPDNPETCHQVAAAWFEQGRYKPAARYLLALNRIAPDYPKLVNAHILMARILFQGFNQDDKARAILEQIRRKHPNHVETPQVERLLEVLARGNSPA